MSRDRWFLASKRKDALGPHVLSCTLVVGHIVIREQLLPGFPRFHPLLPTLMPCVTLGKLLHLSEPQAADLKMKVLTHT